MRLDLHIHSSASDGLLEPAQVVRAAVEGRLDLIALADHDTMAGVPMAQHTAQGLDLEIVPALEMSSTHQGREIHVLGYFVDPESPIMKKRETMARNRREARLREMVERLRDRGVELAFDKVLAVSGGRSGALGRPHLARALVAEGHADTIEDAFERFIGDHNPAFVPTDLARPTECVEAIREVGGVAVWAHPPMDVLEELTRPMVDAGLQGLEAYRPNHGSGYVMDLEAVARSYDLVTTGGSDWHGPDDGPLGDFFVSGSEVDAFLDLGGL